MENALLFDTIGILVGFAEVMLLLSFLVTAIVQLIVYRLGLRRKNLEKYMRTLLKSGNNYVSELSVLAEDSTRQYLPTPKPAGDTE